MHRGRGNTGGNAPAGQWRGAARGNQPYARRRGGAPQGEKPLAIRPAGASPESPIREGVAPDPVVTPVATPATRQTLGRSNTLQPKAKPFESKQPPDPKNLPPAPGKTGAPAGTGATPLPGRPPASGQPRTALPLRPPPAFPALPAIPARTTPQKISVGGPTVTPKTPIDPRKELPYQGHDTPRFAHEPWNHGNAMLDKPFWYDPEPTTITVGGIKKPKLDKKLYESAGDKEPRSKPPPLCNDADVQTAPYKRREHYGAVTRSKDYHPGDVVCAAEHYPDYTRSIPELHDRYRTDTVFGPIYSKERKFVVIQKYHDHCIMLPVFTHAGRGLAAKPYAIREHYISIRDAEKPHPAPPETIHGNLMTTRYPEFQPGPERRYIQPFHIMSNKSAVFYVYPVCHKYQVPCIVESRLDPQSLDYLIHIYLDYGPNPTNRYYTHRSNREITPGAVG